MRPRSLILDVTVELVFHTTLLVSLWLLAVGHNLPGGGFVGGLVAGGGFVLRYVAGLDRRDPRPRISPEALMGIGLVVAGCTAMGAWAFGGQLLESGAVEATLPLLGKVKVLSPLFFDAGVYLVVVGLVLAEIRVLGAEGAEGARRADGDTEERA